MNLDFTAKCEACAKILSDATVEAYWDKIGNVWTIGYGTTGPGIAEGTVWTMDQCRQALNVRLMQASQQLQQLSAPQSTWPPGLLDALTDFVYNEGATRYRTSTLRACVATADWRGVYQHFSEWDEAGGVVVRGLINRRQAERNLVQWPFPVPVIGV